MHSGSDIHVSTAPLAPPAPTTPVRSNTTNGEEKDSTSSPIAEIVIPAFVDIEGSPPPARSEAPPPHPDNFNDDNGNERTNIGGAASIETGSIHSGEDYRPPLLKRFSTFWPSEQDLLKKRHSLELLYPAHDCKSRKSSPVVAIVGLVATVCGGGVLSLPIAFSRAGIIPSTVLMVFAAIITDFAMYILCSCARRTGGRSYGDVAKNAFGPLAEIGVTLLLIFLLCFVLIAYMVLVKDICTPMVLYVWPGLSSFFAKLAGGAPDEDEVVDVASRYILVVILLCTSPLLLKKDLHALRHTCYVGMASAMVLLVGVVHRSIERNVFQEPGLFGKNVVWVGDLDGIMFAFPIICLSFFSIYNVLSVHGSLVNPTRQRVKLVLDGTIGLCLVLFYVIGLAGYLFAYDETSDNILLNFPLSYRLILCGRVGYLLTLCFGLPLITLPCREAALSLPGQLKAWRQSLRGYTEADDDSDITCGDMNEMEHGGHLYESPGETTRLLAKKQMSFYSRYKVTFEEHHPRKNPQEGSHNSSPNSNADSLSLENEDDANLRTGDRFLHYLSTFGLILCAYAVGVSVPGVAVVWSIVGSSMALMIGFVIPCACYLKIRTHKKLNPRSFSAWLLLLFSITASVICTAQTLARIKAGEA